MKITKVIFRADRKCVSLKPVEFLSLQTNYVLAEEESRERLKLRTKYYARYNEPVIFIDTEVL